MWHLENNTPFKAERAFLRDFNGGETWIVMVKATFAIDPIDGHLQIADKQEDVFLGPIYRDQPGKSSLLYEADLVLSKKNTDIILNGHAYSPHGNPTDQVDVVLHVGNIKKLLRVFGDRRWTNNLMKLRMSPPEPFIKIPLTYELAFGGEDFTLDDRQKQGWERRNPVGRGFAMRAETAVDQLLPNIEDPLALITSWKDRPQPAGFGAIARDWSPRIELAGTYDETWEQERQPLLPSDFDERHLQCVPIDQQADGFLKGGEEVGLYNLTSIGPLKFRLPAVNWQLETHLNRRWVQHPAYLHSVILEPDELRFMMVWQSHLFCHALEHTLKSTSLAIKNGEILDVLS